MANALILLVEDDQDIAEAIIDLLGEEGYAVVHDAGGREALERLRSGARPDAMIVDFAMPEMSGTEFLKECARDPMLAGIPVIVTSAMRPADMIAQGLERYLQKPFRPDTLLQQLAALLKGPS